MASAMRPTSGWRALTYALLLAAGAMMWHASAHAEAAVTAPAPAVDEPATGAHTEKAVLAGGCFWGVQGVFAHVNGVTRVVSGYSGGSHGSASYERVSEGDTGHAESVEITFDPTQISYGRLLQVFFSVVQDPTLRNTQGPDEGTQYRSAIFPVNDAQARVASAYVAQLGQAHVFHAPIATGVEKFRGFYAAEDYHQDYLTLHPDDPYIAINDMPKIAELHKRFPALYRPDPLLTSTASR
ncbi:peptide-methionine (S)-S-oxide reductase MsrA [Pararobbsia alpina]|uniref:peptide-methionine (S)-S-oxide reductase MsrA n=1 Tax=Pararobbsia alpina TaxID=621374 RepID=UPI0039A5E4B7